MSTQKTPGVSIEEMALLPASVAGVATAVPVFLGYTERAVQDGSSVVGVPVKIGSLKEFESIFGGAPAKPTMSQLSSDSAGNVQAIYFQPGTRFFLYDSLSLYFANGGGPCYVISIWSGFGAINGESFTEKLPAAEAIDEITLIAMPDLAMSDDEGEMGEVFAAALTQCDKLGDRMTLIDTPDWEENYEPEGDLQSFFSDMGDDFLEYGAAYAPYVKRPGSFDFTFAEIDAVLHTGTYVSINTLDSTGYTAMKAASDDLLAIAGAMDPSTLSLGTTTKTWSDYYTEVSTADQAGIVHRFGVLVKMGVELHNLIDTTQALNNVALTDYLIVLCKKDGPLDGLMSTLKGYNKEGNTLSGISLWNIVSDGYFNGTSHPHANYPVRVPAVDYNYALSTEPISSGIFGTGTPADYYNNSTDAFQAIFDGIYSLFDAIHQQATHVYNFQEADFLKQNKVYANLKRGIADHGIPVPPSGAIAGIYASTDRNRGVWKAPANVSIAGITGLTARLSDADQEEMNDPSNGKAVNALRTFTGQGHLVWGARTLLAGDDNWRYVSVRRFYLYVRESLRKALVPVILEPNDPLTWSKVKGMIGNFLQGLWREGALMGESPEDAFYVKVGVGETMTAQDALNGTLKIEVGMAVVRPAEFVVLRFSHLLQTS